MGTASEWLSTNVSTLQARGATTTRTIVMSGSNTTVVTEDEGAQVSFSVKIEGGLGTIPAGDTGPTAICTALTFLATLGGALITTMSGRRFTT